MGDFTNHPHMRIDGLPPDGISNETEREIDLEVRALIDEAAQSARNCLTEHRDQLEKIAAALLEKETLSIAEINDLLGLTAPETDAAENADGMEIAPDTDVAAGTTATDDAGCGETADA